MKTSWPETEQIDRHITGQLEADEAVLFEAKLLLNPELNDKLYWQKTTHSVIKQYGRRQLKTELDALHHKLFTSPKHGAFSLMVRRLFTKK